MITEIGVFLIQDSMYSMLLMSRWLVGSSNRRRSGLVARALAIATFFCSPPDREDINVSSGKSSPISVIAAQKALSISQRFSFSIFSPRAT